MFSNGKFYQGLYELCISVFQCSLSIKNTDGKKQMTTYGIKNTDSMSGLSDI
jgi:hypothetical protein